MKLFKQILLGVLILTIIGNLSCKKRQEYLNNKVTPNHFLSANKFDLLVIEINYVAGYEPSEAALQNVISFLNNKINKPKGILLKRKEISGANNSHYTLAEIIEIEKKHRQETTKGNTITSYVLFLDKDYIGNNGQQSKILGIQYAPSSIVIFENTIRQYSGGLTQPSIEALETTIIEHEYGHVLGLTNNGSAMQISHEDTSHNKHCNNTNCLMYYAVETSDIISNLLGTGIPELDVNCSNDLKANGGK